jgi:alkylation response protein AidB-like acyl-CoA dehydrogenase
VDLTLDESEREISDAVRSLLTAALTDETIRAIDDAQDAAVLRQVMVAIGSGGWLGGMDDKATLFERMPFFAASGAALVPGLASMAVGASLLTDRPGLESLKAEIESGSTLAVAVVGGPSRSRSSGAIVRQLPGSRLRLRGVFPLVEYGGAADVFFVVAPVQEEEDRWLCAAVDTRLHEVVRHQRATFGNDFTADLALDVTLTNDDVVLGSDDEAASARLQLARDVIAAIRLVECAGGARAVTRRTVSYVNTRHQFGKPLSQFQAVKQRAADMLILSEGAFLLATEALAKVSARHECPAELTWAKSWVPRAYKDVTLSAHQLHGGMGYARESGLFRWSERAKLRQLQLQSDMDVSTIRAS